MSRAKKAQRARKPALNPVPALVEESPIERAVWDLGHVADFIKTSRKVPARVLAGLHEGNDTVVLEALAELASCLECAASELKHAVRRLAPNAESEASS